jgi:hypothetical protein
MSHPTAFFPEIEDLAKFCAELVRQGIMFTSRPIKGGFEVSLTGY